MLLFKKKNTKYKVKKLCKYILVQLLIWRINCECKYTKFNKKFRDSRSQARRNKFICTLLVLLIRNPMQLHMLYIYNMRENVWGAKWRVHRSRDLSLFPTRVYIELRLSVIYHHQMGCNSRHRFHIIFLAYIHLVYTWVNHNKIHGL